MTRRNWAIPAALGFLATIVAANYATTKYGFVPVPFGMEATAGTYFAGAAFVLRDAVSDTAGRLMVLAVILAGAALSYGVAAAAIATASGIAFLVSETADWAVYQPLRTRGYLRAAIASNLVGAVVDTFLFLWIAGFPIADAWQGQLVGKLTITALVVAGVIAARALPRQPIQP